MHTKNLLNFLAQNGSSSAKEICDYLSVSQPVFSRNIAKLKDEILITGKTRSTRYSQIRNISGVKVPIKVFSINPEGKAELCINLYPISPKGFYTESLNSNFNNQFYDDLPYFFDDLRPAGFLGRLIPIQHPAVGYPNDIRFWTSDHCLHYFTNFGWNLVGNLIVGEEALEFFLQRSQKIQGSAVNKTERENLYPELANQILSIGEPGSSAGGEQPKFLATLQGAALQAEASINHVLVKFSPVKNNPLSERKADLLICEHIIHQILPKHNLPSVKSEIISAKNQTFLEIERFDRIGMKGRRGLISLAVLDSEFVGSMKDWTTTATQLLEQNLIDRIAFEKICWLEIFGKLIGNSDMHLWNISFYTDGQKIGGLSPVYDMLPMMYSPQYDNLINKPIAVTPPDSSKIEIWNKALPAAIMFWNTVASDPRITLDFRNIAKQNSAITKSLL
jgi:hypothetical protein